MNRKQLYQPLTSLLPTLAGGVESIPDPLVDLAVSILAQSRYKAPILRPEEEVARTYVCAHLACERLKRQLDLPKIEPRPPCPPKVYEKVMLYLQSVVGGPTSGSGTPSTPSTHPLPQPRLPFANAVLVPEIDSAAGTPARRPRGRPRKNDPMAPSAVGNKNGISAGILNTGAGGWDNTLPEWVLRGIRQICNSFGVRPAATHVLAGVQSIRNVSQENHGGTAQVVGARRSARTGIEHDKINTMPEVTDQTLPVLIIAVFLFTFPRLTGKVCNDGMVEWATNVIAALRQIDDINTLLLSFYPDDDSLNNEIGNWVRAAQVAGWVEMEWYRNLIPGSVPIKHASGDGREESGGEEEDDEDDEDDDGPEDALWEARVESGVSSHLGVHPSVIWFSDRKQEEYKVWEMEMMNRIQASVVARNGAMTSL